VTPLSNVDHAEEVPLGIGEHHERRSVRVGPINVASPEPDQAVYLGDELLLAIDMQVQVHASFPSKVTTGHLVSAGTSTVDSSSLTLPLRMAIPQNSAALLISETLIMIDPILNTPRSLPGHPAVTRG
jgi:hypothetical protein